MEVARRIPDGFHYLEWNQICGRVSTKKCSAFSRDVAI